MPSIRFFLADTDHPIDHQHALWRQQLPHRNASVSAGRTGHASSPMTYGDYFTAILGFCRSNAWHSLLGALGKKLKRPVVETDILQLSIFLEKHGALYHPARLQVDTPDGSLSLVVNVAASDAGRRAISVEMDALHRLGDQRPFGWLPTVYQSTVDPTPMFMADWFDGYHEFHLTRSTEKDGLWLMVWDGADVPCLLSDEQSAELYQKAAMILSACYDPITGHQIFPWHHAAGDFVVRVDANTVDVKLITARDYVPVFTMETEPVDERTLLDNLAAFFIHLTIGMRLDRLDGVSSMVWAPKACLTPVIDGFFKGLDLTRRLSGFPDGFAHLFQGYFNHQRQEQLMGMATQVVQTAIGRQNEAKRVVNRQLERHLGQLRHCLAAHEID